MKNIFKKTNQEINETIVNVSQEKNEMIVDVSQELKDAENSLRDFISESLQKEHGDKWIDNCGVTKERIEKWHQNKEIEEKKHVISTIENRLIYYAEFYDLSTILFKNWENIFKKVFHDRKKIEVFLKILENFRNPDAHRRELLSFQKNIVKGISGFLRNSIVRYRSSQESLDAYFPKIESARDDYGNIYTYSDQDIYSKSAGGGAKIFRPGDQIEFIITATDPYGEDLLYCVSNKFAFVDEWINNNVLNYTIKNEDIGASLIISLMIKSNREHKAHTFYDDEVSFYYTVLPNK